MTDEAVLREVHELEARVHAVETILRLQGRGLEADTRMLDAAEALVSMTERAEELELTLQQVRQLLIDGSRLALNQFEYNNEHNRAQLFAWSAKAVTASTPEANRLTQEEDRIRLWAHCVSEHCNQLDPNRCTLSDLLDYHRSEHEGPGTIRNHPETQRFYSLRKIGLVLTGDNES